MPAKMGGKPVANKAGLLVRMIGDGDEPPAKLSAEAVYRGLDSGSVLGWDGMGDLPPGRWKHNGRGIYRDSVLVLPTARIAEVEFQCPPTRSATAPAPGRNAADVRQTPARFWDSR